MPGNERQYYGGAMRGMPVHDKIDPAAEGLDQSCEELHKDRRTKPALKHHKRQGTLVGNRRDHIAAEALAGRSGHRGLSHGGITAAPHMVAAEPHIIAPVQHGPFAFRLPGQRRVLLRELARDSRVLTLVGPAHQLLRPHPPGLEITPNRDQGHLQTIGPSNEGRYGGSRPQIKRELQLIWHTPRNHRPNACGLLRVQKSLTDSPPPALERQSLQPSHPVEPHPVTHRP